MLHVESPPQAYDDTMSVARFREVAAEELGAVLCRELDQADGTRVPVTWEELSRVEVIEEERGRAVGVRPVFEVYYKEFYLPQSGMLQIGTQRTRSSIRYLLGVTAKQLEQYQPALAWQLVAALVDPVPFTRAGNRQVGYEPTPEEVDVRLASQRLEPSTKLSAPTRLSQALARGEEVVDWRWYFRMAWADTSGGSDYVDPAARDGGRTGLSRYAETRQLRHLPRGTKKSRDRALDIVKQVGAIAVAPASLFTPTQRQAVREMIEAGTNLQTIAAAFGTTPEAVAAELPVVAPPAPAPKRGNR